jgi:hypothetical protein
MDVPKVGTTTLVRGRNWKVTQIESDYGAPVIVLRDCFSNELRMSLNEWTNKAGWCECGGAIVYGAAAGIHSRWCNAYREWA